MKTTRVEFRVKSEELTPAVANRWTSRSFSTISHLPSPISHSTSGFSLVEVMISIGIVAFAVVGILTAFPVGIEAARDARDENTAALIADNIFTSMRSQAWTTPAGAANLKVPRMPTPTTINPGSYDNSWFGGAGPTYPNMIYFARDGQPSYSVTMSKAVGSGPSAGDAFKPDEGYFGVQIYINRDPFGPGNNNPPHSNTKPDESVKYWDYATVSVEVSWPARQLRNNRKLVRQFGSAIANLH